MANRIRKQIDAAIRSADREYGGLKSIFLVWDISGNPTDNSDRAKKLGAGDVTHGGAVGEFVGSSTAAKIVDGVTTKQDVTSRRMFEPDNLVLRLHSEKGREIDGVWAFRMIVEHDNKAQERKHRSTIWLDQCKKQTWAWSQDAFWIVDFAAPIDHRELEFNDAGFLDMIFDKAGKPRKSRGALASNFSQQGGYVTDGIRAGQFWHCFTFMDPGARSAGLPPVATPSKFARGSGPGSTVAAPRPGPGQTQAETKGECKPPTKTELMLRRETKWLYPDKGPVVPPILESPVAVSEVGTIPVPVHFYVDSTIPNDPRLDNKTDPSSNQKRIERVLGQPIKGFVLINESEESVNKKSSDELTYPKEQYDDEEVGTSGFSTSTPTHSASSGTSSEPMQMVALPVVIPP